MALTSAPCSSPTGRVTTAWHANLAPQLAQLFVARASTQHANMLCCLADCWDMAINDCNLMANQLFLNAVSDRQRFCCLNQLIASRSRTDRLALVDMAGLPTAVWVRQQVQMLSSITIVSDLPDLPTTFSQLFLQPDTLYYLSSPLLQKVYIVLLSGKAVAKVL